MLKTILPFGIGVAIGSVAVYGVYKCLKNKDPNNEKLRKEAEYEAKVKYEAEKRKRFQDLIKNQSVVENLTSKDMSEWFKNHKSEVPANAKMIIAFPSDEVFKGLKYPTTESLDKEKNILQWFYDSENGKVLKIRLVNFSNIDSNFQAHLLENNGMIIVSE